MKWIGCFIVAIMSSVLTTLMYTGGHVAGPARRIDPPKVDISYSDFVSISLTVVTVVLGALAIVIGIIAFKTVREIKEGAANVATECSNATINEHMQTVPQQVNTTVDAIVESRLPGVIQAEVMREIEVYASDGRLARIIETAHLRRSFLSPEASEELQEGFDNQNGSGGSHGKS